MCWAIGLTLFRRDTREIGARAVGLFKGMFGSVLFLACIPIVGYRLASVEAQLALVVSGVLGLAIGDTLLFTALAHLGPHRTALIASLGPVFTATGGFLVLGEALSFWQIAGILLAMGGVALVVSDRVPPGADARVSVRGVCFALLGALCHATGVLFAKRGLYEADALSATAIRLLAGTSVLALFGLARRDLGVHLRRLLRRAPLRRLVPAALSGTFFGLWLMQIGIEHTKSGIANALHSTTALFTLPIALVYLKERIGLVAILGSVAGVAGVVTLLLS